MKAKTQTLKIPVVKCGAPGESLPVGEGGTWDLAHAVAEGRATQIEIAAQTDLLTLAEELHTLARALELASAIGRMASSGELARAAARVLGVKKEEGGEAETTETETAKEGDKKAETTWF